MYRIEGLNVNSVYLRRHSLVDFVGSLEYMFGAWIGFNRL